MRNPASCRYVATPLLGRSGEGDRPTTAIVRVVPRMAGSSSRMESALTEVFRIQMRALLHPHRVQRHVRRQPPGDPLPHIDRERFAGREPPAIRELGRGHVDALAIEPPNDLLFEQTVQKGQAHHTPCFGMKGTLHGDAPLIAMPVLGGGLGELGGVPFVGPVRAADTVRRAELDDAGKVADGHRQNTRTALALKENTTGLPGTSPRSRTASSVITATSSTPTSAATCTTPGRGRLSRVTRPENTLRAEAASGSRLTKMSVGGTARIAGPVLSVAAATSMEPTHTCLRPAWLSPGGSSTRNRFSGVTGASLPSARARTSSAQR